MSGKKFGGDKRKRDLMSRNNPRDNKKGGRKRTMKKMSPTKKFETMRRTNPNYTGLERNPLKRVWPNDPETRKWRKENKLL